MLGFTSKIPIFWLLPLFILSTTIFQRCNSTNNTQLGSNCNEKDLSSLLIFKLGLENHSSNTLSSWSNETDCCSWKGVLCHNITRRVIKLDLHQQYLEGEINLQSLFQIEFLSYLDLSLNGFTSISSSFNQSHDNIQYLDLSFNDDLHMDNLNWLSKLSSLKSLNLSQINLQNQTNWLHYIDMHASLLELRLSSCHLTDIFPSTKHVSFANSLVTLDLSANIFDSELPSWLFDRANDMNISYIDLSFNFLKGQIPKSLLSLRKLETLKLSNNELNGSIPDWLGQHGNLKYLSLAENLFHGSIPSSLGNLSSLVDLNVGSNFMTGNIPTTIGKLFNLKSLFIGGNSLSGVLTGNHFSNLSNLEELVLSAPVSFDMNSKWNPPFQLNGISLSNTLLGPKFPAWIYTQKSLEYLEVPNSRLSSIDGDKFWRFVANITQLNLSNNNISADLSNVTLNSDLIFMDHNKFRGGLPRISANVIYLDLSHNSFFGTISPLFCHKLENNFSGPVPVKMPHAMEVMILRSNRFEGPIPKCISNITGMGGAKKTSHYPFEFNLYNKGQDLEYLDYGLLRTLDLSDNNLSDEIPRQTNSITLWLWDLLTEVRDRVHP
ncbi:hypothetical protein P8452_26398 [Trifolium repens]|nr:hypothetical protein P8452_26398 [Trifolium repens]